MMLTPDDVQEALNNFNLGIEIQFFDATTATSQQAADNIGCELGAIAKSMAFMADGKPVLVVASGDQRVYSKKLALLLGISRKRVRIATPEQCVEFYGYAPGGVPPVGLHTEGITVYIDDSLQRYETVYAAGGEHNAIFPILLSQLIKITGGQIVDVKRDE
jgi:prolyl-tRNA editing enzyme YbaK/EbsC (Cys-tRNA(Pro) deacylase)